MVPSLFYRTYQHNHLRHFSYLLLYASGNVMCIHYNSLFGSSVLIKAVLSVLTLCLRSPCDHSTSFSGSRPNRQALKGFLLTLKKRVKFEALILLSLLSQQQSGGFNTIITCLTMYEFAAWGNIALGSGGGILLWPGKAPHVAMPVFFLFKRL